MKDYLAKLIQEGSRVGWTAVQALTGVLVAFNLPEPTWAGTYAPFVKGGVAVAVAAVVTRLKEVARAHLSNG